MLNLRDPENRRRLFGQSVPASKPLYRVMAQAHEKFALFAPELRVDVADAKGQSDGPAALATTPVLYFNKTAFRRAGL